MVSHWFLSIHIFFRSTISKQANQTDWKLIGIKKDFVS